MFLEDGEPEVFIVVGDDGTSSHVIAQTQIAISLGAEFGKPLSGSSKLASEVEDIESINLISIGNACDNNVTAEILGNPEPCDKDLLENQATITLYESAEGKSHIVISSDSEQGIKNASNILANFRDYNFKNDVFTLEMPEGETEKELAESDEDEEDEEEAKETPDEESGSEEEITEEKKETTQKKKDLGIDTVEEPEPVFKEEDDLVKKFFNWIKSLFGIFARGE